MNKLISSTIRVVMVVLLVVTLGFSCVIPAIALTESEQHELINEATDLLSRAPEFNMDKLLTLKDVEGILKPLDVSSYYAALSKVNTDAFSLGKLEFDTNAATTSIEALNVSYASLVANLGELGHGVLGELEIPSSTPGYSSNVVESFNSIYGDLSERENLSVSLPEGWNMTDLMAQASSKRNAEVEKAKESLEYTTTHNTVSLEESLAFAQDVIGTPELKDILELDTMLETSSEAFDSIWGIRDSAGIRHIQNIARTNDSHITIQSQDDLQKLFQENAGITAQWLYDNAGDGIGSKEDLIMLGNMLNLTRFYEIMLLNPEGDKTFEEIMESYMVDGELSLSSLAELAELAEMYEQIYGSQNAGE